MTTVTGTAKPSRPISPTQQKALEVLLVGGTDQQAAEASGVARSTVNGWRNSNAPFIDAMVSARKDMLRRTTARIHAATSLAVKALEEVAKDAKHSGRVPAARALLEFSHQAIEMEELEGRIEELEKAIEEQNKDKGMR